MIDGNNVRGRGDDLFGRDSDSDSSEVKVRSEEGSCTEENTASPGGGGAAGGSKGGGVTNLPAKDTLGHVRTNAADQEDEAFTTNQ